MLTNEVFAASIHVYQFLPNTHKGQKGTAYTLERKSQTVTKHYMDAGDQTQFFVKAAGVVHKLLLLISYILSSNK